MVIFTYDFHVMNSYDVISFYRKKRNTYKEFKVQSLIFFFNKSLIWKNICTYIIQYNFNTTLVILTYIKKLIADQHLDAIDCHLQQFV